VLITSYYLSKIEALRVDPPLPNVLFRCWNVWFLDG